MINHSLVTAGPYADAERALAGTAFSTIEYRPETESTNADAAPLIGMPRSGGQTIVAGFQRHGAGRKGRTWEAPPGSALLFTTILPEEISTRHLWLVPFWSALAVESALRAFGIATLLQWPNDVLIEGAKVAGILCLSQVTGERARCACGIGINVRRTDDGFAGAAYCDDIIPIEKSALLTAILQRFDATLPLLGRPDEIVSRWEAAAAIPGARYRVALDNSPEPFAATAKALTPGGALRVQREDGALVRVEMADARILR